MDVEPMAPILRFQRRSRRWVSRTLRKSGQRSRRSWRRERGEKRLEEEEAAAIEEAERERAQSRVRGCDPRGGDDKGGGGACGVHGRMREQLEERFAAQEEALLAKIAALEAGSGKWKNLTKCAAYTIRAHPSRYRQLLEAVKIKTSKQQVSAAEVADATTSLQGPPSRCGVSVI